MKKFFSCASLLLALCVMLSACGGSGGKAAPDSAAQPPSSSAEDTGIDAGDSDAGDVGMEIPFRVDEALAADLPTEGLSVYDAQKIIVDTIRTQEGDPVAPEGYTFAYVYQGLIDIDGQTCYRIDLGEDRDGEFLVGRTFGVSLSGVLYEGVPDTDAYTTYGIFAAHKDVKGEDMEPLSEDEAIGRIAHAMELKGETSTVIRREGTETIGGESCMTFSAGDNSADGEKYTAMYHYAVGDSGTLWYMDVAEGPDWLPVYTPEE